MGEYDGPERRKKERRQNGSSCPYYDPDEGHCREVTNLKKEMTGTGRWIFGIIFLIATSILGTIQFYNSYQISRLDYAINRLLDKSDNLGTNQSHLMANQKLLMRQFDIPVHLRGYEDHHE